MLNFFVADLTFDSIIIGILVGVVGLIFLFFGIRFFKPILFLTGGCMGYLVTFIVLTNVEAQESVNFGPHSDLIIRYAPFLGSLLVGLMLMSVYKLGVVTVGALGGFSLASFILSWQTNSIIQNNEYRPILLVLLPVLGSVLSLCFERHLIIIGNKNEINFFR